MCQILSRARCFLPVVVIVVAVWWHCMLQCQETSLNRCLCSLPAGDKLFVRSTVVVKHLLQSRKVLCKSDLNNSKVFCNVTY